MVGMANLNVLGSNATFQNNINRTIYYSLTNNLTETSRVD